MTTPYHARYFAHELTRHYRGSGVGTALFNACVKLNPHQVDAALFALRNPLSSGVVLADEVGLGKTIEAGLVLCQMWAERRRRLSSQSSKTVESRAYGKIQPLKRSGISR